MRARAVVCELGLVEAEHYRVRFVVGDPAMMEASALVVPTFSIRLLATARQSCSMSRGGAPS